VRAVGSKAEVTILHYPLIHRALKSGREHRVPSWVEYAQL
jgi:hypothetical protein